MDELRGDTLKFPMPAQSITLALLGSDSLSAAFDNVTTPQRESAGDMARNAFVDALSDVSALAKTHARRSKEPLTWGRARPVSIPHLLRLGPLGVSGLEVSGCADCVNAQKSSHGPSWRMVVQTGKRPEAWGIYPGGQSGNPGSPRYDAFVKDWAEGRGYKLLFLKWPLEVPDSTSYILALKAKR
jgi:penicillin amidase